MSIYDEIKSAYSLQEYAEQHLKRGKNNRGNQYVCPFCGSGTGPDKSGALTIYPDTEKWYCHACNEGGDIIDLHQKITGYSKGEAMENLANQAGIDYQNRPTIKSQPRAIAKEADHTEYYRRCQERLTEPAALAYLSARGISLETALAAGIGYDAEADCAGSGHKSPRIIIPTCPGHYIGRLIEADTEQNKAYRKMNNKGGSPDIFNKAALTSGANIVYITEGAFDALSIMEAGEAAISINSASNVDKFIKQLEQISQEQRPGKFVLCMDNDERGRRASSEIEAGLKRLNIPYIIGNVAGSYKDANEALKADREAFTKAVKLAAIKAAKPYNTTDYINSLMASEIERFKSETKTGFSNLDELCGGLYAGLYVVAAISSLGKTTFCHQMADQIAAAGNDVLFFSLEQSRLELVSKSLARKIHQANPNTEVTSLDIRRGYQTASLLASQTFDKAVKQYQHEVQDRMSIIEGNFSCDAKFIRETIRDYIRVNGTKPVVFVDYLQILQPETIGNRQQSIREVVDSTITELKRLSRELDLTIFVISSVNRSNYLTPIDFESLKESGGIEYSADVIWGLQLRCLNEEIFDKSNNIKERRERIKTAKAATPREIELVCLKNRYGVSSFSAYFNYFPKIDLYETARDREEIQLDRLSTLARI